MTIRNILVPYNGSDSSQAALDTAILMHRKYDAHVTGLLAHSCSKIDTNLRPWMPKTLRQSLLSLENEADKQIESSFFEYLKSSIPREKVHWISERGRADATVSEYARMYDISVIGQYSALQGAEHLELHPDQVALKSGKPVLVIPKDWHAPKIHEHAVLAWDGQRAATRVLADAMQILETKQLVTVLTVKNNQVRKPLNGINVVMALQRHDIHVEKVEIEPGRRSVSEVILDFCAEVQPGLLAIGAYERSIFREELKGGIAQALINKSTLPVLVSN